jgi:hypothetical protein
MAVPVVGSVIWARPLDEASIEDPLELVGGLALAALMGGLILSGVAPLLWPTALAMLAGVVVAFGVANVYVVSLLTHRVGSAASLSDVGGVLLSSLGLVLLELGALAALRSWLIAAFGFTWGI